MARRGAPVSVRAQTAMSRSNISERTWPEVGPTEVSEMPTRFPQTSATHRRHANAGGSSEHWRGGIRRTFEPLVVGARQDEHLVGLRDGVAVAGAITRGFCQPAAPQAELLGCDVGVFVEAARLAGLSEAAARARVRRGGTQTHEPARGRQDAPRARTGSQRRRPKERSTPAARRPTR